MPSTSDDYTSSVSLVVLGESLDPKSITAVLGLAPDDFWLRGQAKRVRTEIHNWGGWKKFLPQELTCASLEDQLNYWLTELLPKSQQFIAVAESGARCSLDVFVSASAAWFKLSSDTTRRLAALPLDIEFTFWASNGAA